MRERAALTNRAGLGFLAVSAVYLVAVVVQFFLAGLGVFGASSFDAHRGLGYALFLASVLLLVLGIVGRLPRVTLLLTLVLVFLNVLQTILATLDDDVPEVAALHVVNALAIFLVAHLLVRRAQGYLASKIAA